MTEFDDGASFEDIQPTTETISGEQLLREITADGKPDPQFVVGGKFAYSPLESPFLHDKRGWFSVVRLSGRIVGIAQVLRDPARPEAAEFRNICIHGDFKGRKLSNSLLREVFSFAKRENSKLYLTPATSEGAATLVHQVRVLAEEYNVPIFSARSF